MIRCNDIAKSEASKKLVDAVYKLSSINGKEWVMDETSRIFMTGIEDPMIFGDMIRATLNSDIEYAYNYWANSSDTEIGIFFTGIKRLVSVHNDAIIARHAESRMIKATSKSPPVEMEGCSEMDKLSDKYNKILKKKFPSIFAN